MKPVRQLAKAYSVLREAWRSTRAPSNPRIFDALSQVFEHPVGTGPSISLSEHLRENPPIARLEPDADWTWRSEAHEFSLPYRSSLFGPGCLRMRPAEKDPKGTLIFLHGFQSDADAAFGQGDAASGPGRLAKAAGYNLVSWDWPLQGLRSPDGLYRDTGSVITLEREYARILPMLGTCLWREIIHEMAFALNSVAKKVAGQGPLVVFGWSMGGGLAYFARPLCSSVDLMIAAGSCAAYRDLLREGKTRLHGYFYYPAFPGRRFDLEDVVRETLRDGGSLLVVHGEEDRGCLASTVETLLSIENRGPGSLRVETLQGHGHVLSEPMLRIVANAVDGL